MECSSCAKVGDVVNVSMNMEIDGLAGLYAPAVLRFQVAFPPRYPSLPLLITFTSDIFHPLVTPLTTYTYTTGSSGTETVSATDEERLVPGGFSLRDGFQSWFSREDNGPGTVSPGGRRGSLSESADLICDSDEHPTLAHPPEIKTKIVPIQQNVPQLDLPEQAVLDFVAPSVTEVLDYVKKSFEDEALLDELPLDAAGNPGAWHAWQAHRRRMRQEVPMTPQKGFDRQITSPHRGLDSGGRLKPPSEWNWDGVWAERVKKGVNSSISEQMLYGNVDGDDLVCHSGLVLS